MAKIGMKGDHSDDAPKKNLLEEMGYYKGDRGKDKNSNKPIKSKKNKLLLVTKRKLGLKGRTRLKNVGKAVKRVTEPVKARAQIAGLKAKSFARRRAVPIAVGGYAALTVASIADDRKQRQRAYKEAAEKHHKEKK